MRLRSLGGSSAFVLALTISSTAVAAPTLRKQMDLEGDITLIGNTIGLECDSGTPNPTVGTFKCAPTLIDLLSPDYAGRGDTAPDFFWNLTNNGTAANADRNVSPGEASSRAVLALPPGATVKFARLYWAGAIAQAANADLSINFTVPGGTAQALTADAADAKTALPGGGSDDKWYQTSIDVTAQVAAAGAGAYTVSGIAVRDFRGQDDETLFGGWSLVVFWEGLSQPKRNLALFDGFDVVVPGTAAEATLSGFQVPKVGFDAKLGVVAYEGDNKITGDSFAVNGTTITTTNNPANNFFNGTRTLLGTGDSRAGDLPQLTGTPQSMGGIDIDVVDITARLKPNDTSATFRAATTQDRYVLGAFVTSIASYQADFSTSAFKTATDKNGGTLQQGDIISYSLKFTNMGNDSSLESIVTDVLDPRISLVGDIQVIDKSGTQTFTSADDSDVATFDAATRTLTVNVGTGANKTKGGEIKVGETVTINFDVKLNDDATGTIPNQAFLSSSGRTGQGSASYETDGDPASPGNQTTPINIGSCGAVATCPAATPICDTTTNTCVGCVASTDCPASAPICDTTTKTCVGCAASSDCSGATPVCDTTTRTCVGCSTTADCSGATPICDATTNTCVGCSSSADCSGVTPICDTTGTKTCVGCVANTDCSGATPVCSSSTRTCVGCLANSDCSGTTPFCESATGTCVGCTDSSQCTDNKVCDATVGSCVDGVDTDGDGLLDDFEDKIGTDKNDADSDDDGVIDGKETDPGGDTDKDGVINALDNDADNDGLQDGTETGSDCKAPGTDATKCIPDADGGATKTSPVLADTDGGGVSDGDEDTNKNGQVDDGERDPLNPADDNPTGNGGAGGAAGAAGAAGSTSGGAAGDSSAGNAGAAGDSSAGNAGAAGDSAAGNAGAAGDSAGGSAGATGGSTGATGGSTGATGGSTGATGGSSGSGASAGSDGSGASSGSNAAGGTTSSDEALLYGQELEGGCSTSNTGSNNPAGVGFFAAMLGLVAARFRRRNRS